MAGSNHVYGYVKVIKKDGKDGSCYPLMYSSIIGSGGNCDIRIHAPGVEDEHCSISPTELGRVKVKNLSKTSTVKVNGSDIKDRLVPLTHCDVISIAHRSFRFEYAPDSPFHFDGNIGNVKYMVSSSGTRNMRESNHSHTLDGRKSITGASGEAISHWNFSPFSSPASRQVAVVTPVMRVQPGDVVNILPTPRRYWSLAVKSHEKLGFVASHRAGSTEGVVQATSDNTQKKSARAGFKIEKKSPHLGAAKKVGVKARRSLAVQSHEKRLLPTPRRAGSIEVVVKSNSGSKKEKKSVGVVCKTNKRNPQRTSSSGTGKKLNLSSTRTKKLASTPSLKSPTLTLNSRKSDELKSLTQIQHKERSSVTPALQSSVETPSRSVGKRTPKTNVTSSTSKKIVSSSQRKARSISKLSTPQVTKPEQTTPGRLSINKISKSQNFGTGKKFDYVSPIECRKRKLAFEEARSERAAKRLKLQGTPKSPDKKKSAALRIMCHKNFSLSGAEYSRREKWDNEEKNMTATSLPSAVKSLKKSMLPVRVSKKSCASKLVLSTTSKKSAIVTDCKSRRVQMNSPESKNKNELVEIDETANGKDSGKNIIDVCEVGRSVPVSQQLSPELKCVCEVHDSCYRSNLLNIADLQIDGSFEFEPLTNQSCRKSLRKNASVGEYFQHPLFGQGTSTPISKVRRKELVSRSVGDLQDSVLIKDQNNTVSKFETHFTPVSCPKSVRNTSRSHSNSLHIASSKVGNAIEGQQSSSLATPVTGKKYFSDIDNSSFINLADGVKVVRENEPLPTPLLGRKSLKNGSQKFSSRSLLNISSQLDTEFPNKSRIFESDTNCGVVNNSEVEVEHPHRKSSRRGSQNNLGSLCISPVTETRSTSVGNQTCNKSDNSEIQNPKSLRMVSLCTGMSLSNIHRSNNLPTEVEETVENYTSNCSINSSESMASDIKSSESRPMSLKYKNSSINSNSCIPENSLSIVRCESLENLNQGSMLKSSEVQPMPRRKSERRESQKSHCSWRGTSGSRKLSVASSRNSLSRSADQVAGVQNRKCLRSSQMSTTSRASFMVDSCFSGENQAGTFDNVNSTIVPDVHDGAQNFEYKWDIESKVGENDFCESGTPSVVAETSLKSVSERSRRASKLFLRQSIKCSDALSEQAKITPPNNRNHGSSFSEEKLNSDARIPSSILKSGRKSGRKSVRSGRKSVVRFMKFPLVEGDSQTFSRNENEDTDTMTGFEKIVPDNLIDSVNAFQNDFSDQTASDVSLSKQVLQKLHSGTSPGKFVHVEHSSVKRRRPSFKTNSIILSTSKRRRNAKGEISVRSDTALYSFDSFDNSDAVELKRSSGAISEKFQTSAVTSDFYENSNTGSYLGNETSFDFDSVQTPLLSKEIVVSPLSNTAASSSGSRSSTNSKCSRKIPSVYLVDIGIERSDNGSNPFEVGQSLFGPLSNSSDTDGPEDNLIYGLESEMLSESMDDLKSPLISLPGIKNLRKSSRTYISRENSLKNVEKAEITPKQQKSAVNDLSDVRCLRSLTPKKKFPVNHLTDVGVVKKLLNSPKPQKSPLNDLSDVVGLRRLMTTPKTPKSPVNDLTDVGGVKKLFRSPRTQKSPLNDLSDVVGLRRLMTTPKTPKSPVNDLTDVRGVKKLFGTPKTQKSPLNDLSDVKGIRGLMTAPKSPTNDLSDDGIKKLFTSPKPQESAGNDLSDVRSLRRLKTPKSPANDLTDVEILLRNPKLPTPRNSSLGMGSRRLVRSPKTQESPLNILSSDMEGLLDIPIPNSQMNELNVSHLGRLKKTEKLPVCNDSAASSVDTSVEEKIVTSVKTLKPDVKGGISTGSPARMTRSRKIVAVCANSSSSPTSTKHIQGTRKVKQISSSPILGAIEQVSELISGSVEQLGCKENTTFTKEIIELKTMSPAAKENGSVVGPLKRFTRKRHKLEETVVIGDKVVSQNEEGCRSPVTESNFTYSPSKSRSKACAEEDKILVCAKRTRRGKVLQGLESTVSRSGTLHRDIDSSEIFDVSKEADHSDEHIPAKTPCLRTTSGKDIVVVKDKVTYGMTETPNSSPSSGGTKSRKATRPRNIKQAAIPNVNENESVPLAAGAELKRQTRRNKKVELVETISSEQLASQESINPDAKIRKGRLNKKTDSVDSVASEQHILNHDNTKPGSGVRKGRRKKTESVESLAPETLTLVQESVISHSRVRKGRSNKTGSDEKFSSGSVLGKENTKLDEEIRNVKLTNNEVVENTVSKQPARKTRQMNKENFDNQLAEVPEKLIPSSRRDNRSRRVQQSDKEVTAKLLSPEKNVLQEVVQKRALSKHVSFLPETEDFVKSQVTTRKRKVASSVDEKPSRKRVLREPTQENSKSPSPRNTRSRRAR